MAGIGRSCPSGVVLICSRAMCMSLLELKHFFILHFMYLMHASTCLLLWWWYDDDTACSIFRLLQKFLNFSKIKLPLAFDIFLLGIMYSEKTTLNANIKLLIVLQSSLLLKICYGSLQYRDNFCYLYGTCPHQVHPMVLLRCHAV